MHPRSDSCTTVQVSPTTLEEMFDCIRTVGEVLGVPERSNDLCKSLRCRLEVVNRKLADREIRRRSRVLSLEGLAPLCVGGGWLPDVKWAAGCEDALGDVGRAPARVIQCNDVANADPDGLVIRPCSASTARTLNELHLLNSPEFWKLRCVQNGDLYVIDHGRVSRPSPRLVDAVEMLSVFLCNVLPPNM